MEKGRLKNSSQGGKGREEKRENGKREKGERDKREREADKWRKVEFDNGILEPRRKVKRGEKGKWEK